MRRRRWCTHRKDARTKSRRFPRSRPPTSKRRPALLQPGHAWSEPAARHRTLLCRGVPPHSTTPRPFCAGILGVDCAWHASQAFSAEHTSWRRPEALLDRRGRPVAIDCAGHADVNLARHCDVYVRHRFACSSSPSAGSTPSTHRLKNVSEARYRARAPSFSIANASGRGSGKEKGERHTKYAL